CEYSEVVPVLKQFIRLYAVKRSNFTIKLDFDDGTPPEHAWRRKLSSHANRLKEFNVTFREAFKMMKLGLRLWSYVREEASQGRKAPIDPFTRESTKPSASQGVPLGGMGKSSDDGISSWDWKLRGDRSTYHALFPRAWTVYDGMLLIYFSKKSLQAVRWTS
uniref:Glycosyl-hydrolase family 116 N-terminal domain-containing protein n=1 Tax=Aegilops tauschii subsp. strangulata TaxID=200361 RepID=A0A452YPI1_AEGTS